MAGRLMNMEQLLERELVRETEENSEKNRTVKTSKQEEREVCSSETSVNFDYSLSVTGHRCEDRLRNGLCVWYTETIFLHGKVSQDALFKRFVFMECFPLSPALTFVIQRTPLEYNLVLRHTIRAMEVQN
jgi:hypothetical protein